MASDAANAFLVNSYILGNQFGPNPFSKFQGPFPMPGYKGAAVDAKGVNVYGPPGSDYLSLMANPGPVTTPGAQPTSGAQPMSVLDSFLTNNSPGTGAGGGYSNAPFFNTLKGMGYGGGSVGVGSGAGNNISLPIYQSATSARPVYDTPAPAAAPVAAAPVSASSSLPSIDQLASSYYQALGAPAASTDSASQLQAASRAAQAMQYPTPFGTSVNTMPNLNPGSMNMRQYQQQLAAASPEGGQTNPYQIALLRNLLANPPAGSGYTGGRY